MGKYCCKLCIQRTNKYSEKIRLSLDTLIRYIHQIMNRLLREKDLLLLPRKARLSQTLENTLPGKIFGMSHDPEKRHLPHR